MRVVMCAVSLPSPQAFDKCSSIWLSSPTGAGSKLAAPKSDRRVKIERHRSASRVARRRPDRPRPAVVDRVARARSPGPRLYATRTIKSHAADQRAGERGLSAAGGLEASGLAKPGGLFRAVG